MGNIDAVDKWHDGDMDRISWGQQDQDRLTLGLRGWDTDERAGFHQREKRRIPLQKEQHGANGNGIFRNW